MSIAPYRSWVEVSRLQLARNFRAVQDVVGSGVAVMPVVKADAYRHGAIEVSKCLAGEGAKWLAVSSVEEGVALRDAGISTRILVMADFLPAARRAMLEYQITPVIHSLDELADLDTLAANTGAPVKFHLKIDSGLGRLGTRAGAHAIAAALTKCSSLELEGLLTHFASVADFSSHQTSDQMRYFLDMLAQLRGMGIDPPMVHMSSTGAVAYGRREAWGNLVRVGHAIYGYTTAPRGKGPANLLSVKPALSWKAAILTVKDVQAGALIGYGGMFRAPSDMRVAALAVGYADGFPHRLSNRGHVIAGGIQVPILGAVSMDLTTIDVTHCPDLKPGDAVTLLGTEGSVTLDAQEIARVAGTISYSVLCGIGPRVKQVYVD